MNFSIERMFEEYFGSSCTKSFSKAKTQNSALPPPASLSPVEGPESPLLRQVEEAEGVAENEGRVGD